MGNLCKNAPLINLSNLKMLMNRFVKIAAENTAHYIYQIPLSLCSKHYVEESML